MSAHVGLPKREKGWVTKFVKTCSEQAIEDLKWNDQNRGNGVLPLTPSLMSRRIDASAFNLFNKYRLAIQEICKGKEALEQIQIFESFTNSIARSLESLEWNEWIIGMKGMNE